MHHIQQNIKKIYDAIYIASNHAKRDFKDIKLIIVSKNQSINNIKIAASFAQNNFGENYAQEALKKIKWFKANSHYTLIWHFIGILQSNKTRIIAEHFDWCHTITNSKLAYKLNLRRLNVLNHLNVLIQINASNDGSRSGLSTIDDMLKLAKIIHSCTRLKLRGIMSASAPLKTFEQQLLQFKKVSMFFHILQTKYSYIDTLSLGISNDISAAIHAGSNLLRIGTAIFGNRT